ncbi:hypothetical protein BG844_17625 [Couchioplanes caeruleus subsp. caeruleus]|uniref:Uncharacterized protein n=1 Tax=Couchioplanes caeruleus subsp. caeruleus TaxID=56427 RepID=A0A1K0FJI9_9ACTN|nr:hypothetical protein BG844_17625 [Couchioplanes caeruleus subsp. caeruleus]
MVGSVTISHRSSAFADGAGVAAGALYVVPQPVRSEARCDWRGRPLTSHDVAVQCIAATTTRSGL